MNQQIFSIYDKKMDKYHNPMFVESIVEVQRQLVSVIQDEKSLLAQFPTDYEIMNLGEFNQQTGEIIPLPKPLFMMNITQIGEQQ